MRGGRRRRFVLFAAVVVALAAPGLTAPAARADTVFSGRVLDLRTGAAIGGATVSLADAAGHPVSGLTTTTGIDGRFTIPGATAPSYHVRVDGAAVDYSPGWLGSGTVPRGRYLVDTIPESITFAPSDLGDIVVFPAFFRGRFLDTMTGVPVAGVGAQAREDSTGSLVSGATAISGADGRFVIHGTPTTRATPSYHIVVTGSGVGYEDGEVGVVPEHPLGRPVVPHGGAVSLGAGDLGDIVLDRAGASVDDTWGFNYLSHTTVPPGTEITGAAMRQVSHDTPEAAGDRSRLVPIRVADQMCNNVTYLKTLTVLDSTGRTVVVSPPVVGGPAPRTPLVIPAGTPEGTYYLRIDCSYGTEVGDFGVAPPRGGGLDLTDPAYRMPVGTNRVSVCARFRVTAPGTAAGAAFDIGPPHGDVLTPSSPPLRLDVCPVSTASVVGRVPSLITIGVSRLIDRIRGRIVLPTIVLPVESTTTTSTTTTTAPPASSGGGSSASPTSPPTEQQQPPTDTTPPSLSNPSFSQCFANGVSFSVTATDDVGIKSVDFSWSTTANTSGVGSMSGGPPTYTSSFGPQAPVNAVVNVSVIATDTAGHQTPSSSKCQLK